MTRFTTALLLSTIATGAIVASADAQTTIQDRPGQTATTGNDADGTQLSLLGTGATSIGNILVQQMNCIGGVDPLGNQNGTTATIAEPAALQTPGGAFNCGTNSLQPNFSGKYVGTGSGFGRTSWRTFANNFANTPAGTPPFTGGTFNPFNPFNPNDADGSPWTHVQFAFADSSITPGDLTTYNTSAAPTAGAPIFFPTYVLPVAIAYNPVYGRNTATGTNLTFNVANPQMINGRTVGGLRLTRELYCKVFNGETKNFNSSLFTAANNNTPLFDPVNDTSARWTKDGVPVRLVGRLDKSGTTDIFTRALAAQCPGVKTTTNKYLQNAESLPYARGAANTPDFSAIRPDTAYRASATTDTYAGTTTMIGNQYFNGTAITNAGVTGGGRSSYPSGTNGSGLYLLADGSGRVRDAINFAPDYSSPSQTTIKLNGKIGYIGADFIAGSPTGSATLFAAALQVRSTTTFNMPSAANATAAFGTILPPQSNASGYFTNSDTRTVRTGASTTGVATRTNPLAWYDVLYSTGSSLADPTTGYSITGTTQFMGYTCYTPQNRQHVVNMMGWNTDGVTQDKSGVNRTGIFTNATTGLLALSNIGALPTAWKNAITKTFLFNSGETAPGNVKLGSLNLWIQSTTVPGGTANPTCSGKTGA